MFTRVGEITEHASAVYDLQYDGKFIYSASSDKFVARWNYSSLEQDNFAIRFPATPYSISLSPDNKILAVGLSSGELHLFSLEERIQIKEINFHKNGIFTLQFIPQVNWLFSADAEGLISIWDAKDFSMIIRFPIDCGKIRCVQYFSETDSLIFGAQDGKLYSICCTNMNISEICFAHKDGVGSIIYLEDKKTFVTGGKDGHLRVWTSDFKLVKEIPAHNFMIYDLVLLENGQLISASRDKSIKVWNIDNWTVLQKLDLKTKGHRHSVNQLISLGGTKFASCSDDKRILIWDSISE